MALNLIWAPVSEPITLAEARAITRSEGAPDDAVMSIYIAQVRDICQHHCERQLMTATWRLTLDGFPGDNGGIVLPYPPLQSVTSIVYTDADGASQTLDASLYAVDTRTEPAWVVPAEDEDWPDTADVVNAVTITYTAGYASRDAVPADLRVLMLAHVAQLYDSRTGDWKLDHILAGYRRWWHGCRTVDV